MSKSLRNDIAKFILSLAIVGAILYAWIYFRTVHITHMIQEQMRQEFSNREDRWKNYDMINWADKLQEANPDLRVPKVEQVK